MFRFFNFSIMVMFFFASFHVYAGDRAYAVVDLSAYGCDPLVETNCFNTEMTKLITSIIEDENCDIHAFPYLRAVHMFETGKSKVLVAFMNKRLANQSHVINLFSETFYLVALNNTKSPEDSTVAYLRGADARQEIAQSVGGISIELNDYHQMINLIKAHRIDYAIVPRYIFESAAMREFISKKIISSHAIPLVVYVKRSETQHLEQIRNKISQMQLNKL